MQLKPLIAGVIAAFGMATASAATVNFTEYTLTYDDSTTFGGLSGSFGSGSTVGFNWTVPDSVHIASVGGAAVSNTFTLPSFTVTANAGYVLSGPVTGFLGNLVYTEVGTPTITVTATADVSVNGSPAFAFGGTIFGTETSGIPGVFSNGYYSGTQSAPIGAFTSFSVSNATLALSASGGTFASITAQPQNKLEFSFTAAPVPEPETYALMMAGLAVVGFVARRRPQA